MYYSSIEIMYMWRALIGYPLTDLICLVRLYRSIVFFPHSKTINIQFNLSLFQRSSTELKKEQQEKCQMRTNIIIGKVPSEERPTEVVHACYEHPLTPLSPVMNYHVQLPLS